MFEAHHTLLVCCKCGLIATQCCNDEVATPVFQCGNLAREGLRTLVVAKKTLTEEQYQDFEVSSGSKW